MRLCTFMSVVWRLFCVAFTSSSGIYSISFIYNLFLTSHSLFCLSFYSISLLDTVADVYFQSQWGHAQERQTLCFQEL